ncbi:MAG: hypothetical protein EBT90_09990 [Rhodobacteraceae bacterium]|nr:hypothetical protein [Paracoccaceae bacterium]
MNYEQQNEVFGDFVQHERACEDLYGVLNRIHPCAGKNEFQKLFICAAIRRTLSLSMAFKQAVEGCNGQVALTLIRLNLDTLARTYVLYWADETEGMSAEQIAKEVFDGRRIRDMKFRGAKEKATDQWLIKQINPLADWLPKVYKTTSGAIHFSDFHIKHLLRESSKLKDLDGAGMLTNLIIGPTEKDTDANYYREIMQAFLHITMMFVAAVQHRVAIINS